jgi:hypothetical protein
MFLILIWTGVLSKNTYIAIMYLQNKYIWVLWPDDEVITLKHVVTDQYVREKKKKIYNKLCKDGFNNSNNVGWLVIICCRGILGLTG